MKKNINYFENRRKALKLMMLGSGAIIAPGLFTACGGGGEGNFPLQPVMVKGFPQSVASGDPRPNSVVLWTRVTDPDKLTENLNVTLEVSLNDDCSDPFYTEKLIAYSEYDHAIKIKIDNLIYPYTHYYYRFKYEDIYSNIGRTKTAAAEGSTTNVKFAYISCQDYIGRYYNVFAHMLQQDDLDFIVHLGDYIYETNGEPLTQIVGDERQIIFRDKAGTIHLNGYEAAKSTDNYRQLYQVYRSDPLLQQIHERFPMIAIWDDHEFSDDNYGAHSNYYGDKKNELDNERFHTSQRVYLEYMPMEVGLDTNGVMSLDSEVLLDDDNEVIIYRDFKFGSYLDLILSDYRAYRPDHLIHEDVFPGTVFADKNRLISHFGNDFYNHPDNQKYFAPYINVGSNGNDSFGPVLKEVVKFMYEREGLSNSEAEIRANSVIQDNLNAYYCNEMIKTYNEIPYVVPKKDLIYKDESELDHMDRGLAYINGGKIDLFSLTGIGARYMVSKNVFDIYIELKRSEGAIDSVYGFTQDSWISTTLEDSSALWRVYASSVSLTPMIIDLSNMEGLDPFLKTGFYINLDQFDGFKYQKKSLIDKLREKPSIVISGDIHSTFVTDHHGVIEFTGSSVSSSTFSESLPKYIENSNISDYIENSEEFLENLDQLLIYSNQIQYRVDPDFPLIKTANTSSNAYVLIEVNEDNIYSSIYSITAEMSVERLYEVENINDYFSLKSYSVSRNDMSLSDV